MMHVSFSKMCFVVWKVFVSRQAQKSKTIIALFPPGAGDNEAENFCLTFEHFEELTLANTFSIMSILATLVTIACL